MTSLSKGPPRVLHINGSMHAYFAKPHLPHSKWACKRKKKKIAFVVH